MARMAPEKRRTPPPHDRYRAIARAAKAKRLRRRLPALATGIVWGLVLASAVLVADAAGAAITRAGGSLNAAVTNAVQVPVATAQLKLGETTGQVGAAPLLDATPQYTKEPALIIQGIVPSFGRADGRKVSVALNNATAIVVPFDANGHFAVPVTLVEGTNQLVVALESPTKERIAATTVTVVLDRVPPPLTLSKPKNGDTVDGPNVTVDGKAEPGATVLVNDHLVIVGQDGSFSDAVSAPAGTLPLTVIARDRAGNETRTQLSVTVTAPATTSGATLTVTLANATVKPGGFVLANITLLNGTTPLSGQIVSLQVGVIAIGGATTDAAGHAAISFAAPPNEGTAQVVVLAGQATGSALLTVAK